MVFFILGAGHTRWTTGAGGHLQSGAAPDEIDNHVQRRGDRFSLSLSLHVYFFSPYFLISSTLPPVIIIISASERTEAERVPFIIEGLIIIGSRQEKGMTGQREPSKWPSAKNYVGIKNKTTTTTTITTMIIITDTTDYPVRVVWAAFFFVVVVVVFGPFIAWATAVSGRPSGVLEATAIYRGERFLVSTGFWIFERYLWAAMKNGETWHNKSS